jgi:hypothetical protein
LCLAFPRGGKIGAALKPQQLNRRIVFRGMTCGSSEMISETLFQINRASNVNLLRAKA